VRITNRRWNRLSGSTRRYIEKLVLIIAAREQARRHSKPMGLRYAPWQQPTETEVML